ncbi:MAG: hypothetical protein HOC23_16110 [Halieaceae bacterium]|jgi:hypothetical protein|nr:hypothetical protein [Halieaceae bacterium]
MKALTHSSTIALYQALSPAQLAALIRADWRRIEPDQGGELFLFLKLNQRYAEMIARQWEVPLYGAGYVVRLILPESVMTYFDLETVAYEEHLEYRVPACELDHINSHLVGEVSIVSAFLNQQSYSIPAGTRPLASLIG